MKDNIQQDKIVIPVPTEGLKRWTCRLLETMSWCISFGLLAASVAVAGIAGLVWLIRGGDTLLAIGVGGSIVLALAGVRQLSHRIDRATRQLRR